MGLPGVKSDFTPGKVEVVGRRLLSGKSSLQIFLRSLVLTKRCLHYPEKRLLLTYK